MIAVRIISIALTILAVLSGSLLAASGLFDPEFEFGVLNTILSSENIGNISLELIFKVQELTGENVLAIYPLSSENQLWRVITPTASITISGDSGKIITIEEKNCDLDLGAPAVSLEDAFALAYLQTGVEPIAGLLVKKGKELRWEIFTRDAVITIDSEIPMVLDVITPNERIKELKVMIEKEKKPEPPIVVPKPDHPTKPSDDHEKPKPKPPGGKKDGR
ncbi:MULTISPECIES: hypothetical protein [Kosmotoga]|uniref:Uncharacterized protein n=1 Tax=Kosmotoga olearia (strain ATCC BAA-1733 / DSM 21960 / TBF 19.5.1) TaxID=521045 RepID=C5CE20_KOSOT|nr:MULTISPECIES: hypothetical protein [Kosmotoga]ACR80122.1 hypothetical protein Kole_1430 [Kosmotoga olearia TBF 19.5.1]OAA20313.1 hypothetical protein DU53_07910 [Kosmotoga sp. DU53]